MGRNRATGKGKGQCEKKGEGEGKEKKREGTGGNEMRREMKGKDYSQGRENLK